MLFICFRRSPAFSDTLSNFDSKFRVTKYHLSVKYVYLVHRILYKIVHGVGQNMKLGNFMYSWNI